MPAARIINEKEILLMVARGDRPAFAQLYNEYLPALYRYVFLFTKSEDDTEEILQELFVKVWEQRDKLPHITSIEGYLIRMAKHKILDNIRQLQTRHRILSEIKRSGSVSRFTTTEDCAYREYYKVVQMAVSKLPPKRKLIFRLNTENGLSQDEIARQLQISKSVVKKQLLMGTRSVRRYLFEHGEILVFMLLAGIWSFPACG